MANVDSPSGFKPVGHIMGGTAGRFSPTRYRMQSGYAGASIFTGDMVVLTSGYVVIGTDSTSIPLGVFAGCQYSNAAQDNIPFQPYWPTGTVTYGSADFDCFVWDDPGIIYEVQCDTGTDYVQATHLGNFYDIETDHAGSARTGQSGMEIDLNDSGTGQWHVIGLVDRVGNAAGANAKLLVTLRRSAMLVSA